MQRPRTASPSSEPETEKDQSTRRSERRATLAGFVGSMLEYYDYFIYASAAALVFERVFFSAAGDLSLLVSLTSFGVAYAARPAGALLWGHFGDTFSRKQILVMTLLLMGVSTFAIGLIPSYDSIGLAAPVLLVICRLLQGVSAAGETAGASSLVVESSSPGRRAANSSWIQAGNLSGFILATLVFVPVATLPDEALYSWGWRIPFLGSAVLVIVAYVIRRSLEEPQVLQSARREGRRAPSPLRELARNHKLPVARLAGLGLFQGTHTMITVFGLTYATQFVGVARPGMLWILVAVSVIALITVPLGGVLADRIGRRPVFLLGSIGSVGAFVLFLWAASTGSVVLVLLAGVLAYSGVYSLANGSTMALFAEQFDVRVRYSGLAVGMQLAGLVFGFAPTIAVALLDGDASRWPLAAAVQAVLCLVATIACLTVRETAHTPVHSLGRSASA